MNKTLSLITPAFNEEEILESSIDKLTTIINSMVDKNLISNKSQILIVDDGSTDNTWILIEKIVKKNKLVKAIKFSKNFGHQNAIIAGIDNSLDFDYSITIDIDLQDDPNKIVEMVEKANNGTNIVYGVRNSRETDSWFKRNSAKAFYKLMNWLGASTIPNHADFRLLDKKAMSELTKFNEHDLFVRGIVTQIGLQTDQVAYARTPRTAGESKYPLYKMLQFAYNGLISFSIRPIRLVRNAGIIVAAIGIVYLIYTIWQKFNGNALPGWPSLIVSIWILGGLQLVAIGVVGEYIGSIFKEVKNRPRYIIEQELK